MPRYPGATWRPVDRYQSGALRVSMKPRRGVVHTAVTNANSLHSFFNEPGRATPHGYIGESEFEQYIELEFRASACLDGNVDCIALETWDGFGDSWNGSGPGPRFNDYQVRQLAEFMVFCMRVYSIPLRRLKSSILGRRGWGWHRLGIDGNFPATALLRGRVFGGQRWSTSFGKACPTDTRIRQFVDEALVLARQLDQAPITPQKETVVSNRVEEALQLIHQSIADMKPSRRRSQLQHAARLLRKVIGKDPS